MTVSALPFKAVLLACDNGHYEATIATEAQTFENTHCLRCHEFLRLVKTVTIWPGGRR